VPQIVEVEVRQLRALDGVLPGRTEVVPAPGPEDQAAALRATACKHSIGAAVQGHLTPLTAFRNVELDDATGAVHALPGQPEHLATTHPGEERELYQIGQRLGELNEKQEEYLKDIHASGEHLLSLINDILDLSKIEAGRMELELSEFDLPTALDSALTLVRERAGRRGIALHMNVDSRLGQIQADERKVRQVVLNLLPRRRSAHPPR
jgi:signal transduction histidine kinase